MYLVERTVAGEYLNKDGTTTTDKDVADIYASVQECFNTGGVPTLPRNDIKQLVPVTTSRVLGTPVA